MLLVLGKAFDSHTCYYVKRSIHTPEIGINTPEIIMGRRSDSRLGCRKKVWVYLTPEQVEALGESPGKGIEALVSAWMERGLGVPVLECPGRETKYVEEGWQFPQAGV